MDIKLLFGFLKKSKMSFCSPIKGIESGNSLRKNESRSSGVFSDVIRDSGMKRVQVNDLSYKLVTLIEIVVGHDCTAQTSLGYCNGKERKLLVHIQYDTAVAFNPIATSKFLDVSGV